MEPQELQLSIRAAKAGRQEGYHALLAAYGPRLYGYFHRATGNRHEAEDLVGEVMLRLVRTLGRYDERGRFEPWLFRIAANLVRDRIRRQKAAPSVGSLSGDADDGRGPLNAVAGRTPPVGEAMAAAEQRDELMAALATLDESTRQMIVLRHYAEMSFAEIAELMGCPLGTALARVHRGLKALRRRMEPPPGGLAKGMTDHG